MELKFKLTDESKINDFGIELFRIEAIVDIPARGVKKGDKGGWVESEYLDNGNARVYGDAWVYGNAEVYGNAALRANFAYEKGRFIGGDDSIERKVAEITDKTGSGYWRHQYVIGDYKISPIESETDKERSEAVTFDGEITIDGRHGYIVFDKEEK